MPKQTSSADRETTALVLSAGGVFGAYQAGVWRALCDSFTPDVIVGASIGAVNGWLISGGCSPDELAQLWLHADDLLAVRPKLPRRWSEGVLDGAALEARLAEICGNFRPTIPLSIALTDVRRLKPVLSNGPDLGCPHLLASCAVPLAFDLRRIDGALYADGGVLGALPLWAAPLLGVTRVVAVNVVPTPPFPVRALLDFVRRQSRTQGLTDGGLIETTLIQPEAPLGSYFGMLRYRRDRIERWIEAGYRDGEKYKHSIAKCFARQ